MARPGWGRGGGLLLLLLALAGGVGGLPARPAAAQTAPALAPTQIVIDFPRTLTFSAVVESGSAEAAVLFYKVLPDGAINRQPAEITTGAVTRLTASVPVQNDAYLPAGALMQYWWGVTPSGGAAAESARQIYRYEDPRYDWQEITEAEITVHYYHDEAVARRILTEVLAASAEMAALLQVTLPYPVHIYVWRNNADGAGVSRSRSEGFDELIITGGTRVLTDVLHIFQPTPWVARHEFTHILTKIAGEGGIGSLPAWLDEGTATYGEGNWRTAGSFRGPDLDAATRSDTLLTLRSMGSSPGDASKVNLFYGESADIVTFLIDQYGAAPFAQLYAVFNEGSTIDNALRTVYGLDRDGVEDAYRTSLGLGPRVRGEDQSTRIDSTAPGGGSEATAADPAAEGAEPRTAEAIAARKQEILARQLQRRPAPVFADGGGFPWAWVVVGGGGAALVLGLAALWRVSGRRPVNALAPATVGAAVGAAGSADAQDTGDPSPPREGASGAWSGEAEIPAVGGAAPVGDASAGEPGAGEAPEEPRAD